LTKCRFDKRHNQPDQSIVQQQKERLLTQGIRFGDFITKTKDQVTKRRLRHKKAVTKRKNKFMKGNNL
jgi:hypothetical protein